MEPFATETTQLVQALGPASAYIRRAEAKLDATTPASTRRHLEDVKLAVTGAIDFAKAVAARLTPPADSPAAAQARLLLEAQAWRLTYTPNARRQLAAFRLP